ncbi:GerMN domain-containing protein [Aeromicrobium sp. A1-2]|uniref:GerMN domain-containing protein n=1 Tax=Aeromicrobium sp. A1-2 TaxID=2107713 RepID=UPI0013C35553|nr:LpqB family beta-propeller domain-containing protein [Aeromicrobium sp. A1-2]
MTRLVAGIATVLVVSACAGIPTSGPVTKVADDSGFGESTVRYTPARPSDGASPQQIVRGYLDAMLAYPVSTGTAAAFLTPEGAKSWSSAAQVRVYSNPEVSPTLAGRDDSGASKSEQPPVEVRLRLAEDARLDRQGHYARVAEQAEISYELERVDGQWRIANPQAGLLVNQKFFEDYFRRFNIFYFDRPGSRLVPDPIYLPVGDQLATGLIASLVRGPGAAGDGAERTYVPGTDSLRPSVPVSANGVADVEFATDLSALSDTEQKHLSAQIVWTLRQVPEVVAVRLVGDATVLTSSGNALQDIDSWGGYGPSIARTHTYAIAGDKIVQIDDGKVEPMTGAWGTDARGAVFIGVSEQGVAGVLAGRTAVRVTNRKGTAARTFDGSRFIAPRWDSDGGLWLVDRPGSRTRVRLVVGKDVRTLDVGGLTSLEATDFAISPDGSRYAVTAAGSSLHVGRVLRDAKDQILGLGEPSRVYTSARAPRSVSWSSGTELTFLAESQSGRQVYSAAIDGSSTNGGVARGGALLPDVDAGTLAIDSGESRARYATDARDRLWFLSPGGSWRLLTTTGVTALTTGR